MCVCVCAYLVSEKILHFIWLFISNYCENHGNKLVMTQVLLLLWELLIIWIRILKWRSWELVMTQVLLYTSKEIFEKHTKVLLKFTKNLKLLKWLVFGVTNH